MGGRTRQPENWRDGVRLFVSVNGSACLPQELDAELPNKSEVEIAFILMLPGGR